ncbi:MAG: dTDP-4-dehydrorhamnose reductase [Spartobacteria bacterium]|nr:dTDP-4-dehydrorhamnose reductase [Spartobacteria bacterium]
MVAPESPDRFDWAWTDSRLQHLQSVGLQAIGGLLHHGSGPSYTNLIDPQFAQKFARYAGAIARRYPWLEHYTPVNEPLTTARFSALYGHWYPHARDEKAFVSAFLAQCRAVVLGMRAIRAVNSSALLVQTEDLGCTSSTPHLRYQADFENERRWLTWDLLRGVIDRNHPMWSYFKWAGVDDEQLMFFADNPCPADIIGINYYVTSERFLDENLEWYPPETHGGNGRESYADDAAVRARSDGIEGVYPRLIEAWQRYGTSMALTEVHLGCTLDEQLRWFMEMWRCAVRALNDGCDVRAFTSWALLGSFDWDALVTRQSGTYEPGAFDVRGDAPRATAIAAAIQQLSRGESVYHPALDSVGWWHRPSRLRRPCQLTGTGTVLS